MIYRWIQICMEEKGYEKYGPRALTGCSLVYIIFVADDRCFDHLCIVAVQSLLVYVFKSSTHGLCLFWSQVAISRIFQISGKYRDLISSSKNEQYEMNEETADKMECNFYFPRGGKASSTCTRLFVLLTVFYTPVD